MDSRFLKGVAFGIFAAAIQVSLFAGPEGLRANWILAALAAYAFVLPGFFPYIVVSLIASLMLFALSGFMAPSYAVFTALICAYGIRRFFPLRPLPSYLASLFVAILVLYALIDPGFIALHPYSVAIEAACTAIIGILFHAAFGRFYHEKGRYPS